MEQQIKAYLSFIEQSLADFRQTDPGPARVRRLLAFHLQQVAAFQHERLIHLLVTFFFASLFVLGIAGSLFWGGPAWIALDLLIGVTLLFYIRYYYFLENSVQKLYLMTEALHRLLEDSLSTAPPPDNPAEKNAPEQ